MIGVLSVCLICLFSKSVTSLHDEIGVVREEWRDVQGDSLQNLLADSRFPHRPTIVKFIKSFDATVDEENTNQIKNNAQRIKGYFVAPQDGEYKFYSSCGGTCEVFLGMNGMEGENNRIISQSKSSKRNEFNRYPEQVSHTIALEKGKKYYLEAIGKQEDSDDNLSVGVELPDGKKMFPIPGSLLRKSKVSSDEEADKNNAISEKIIVPKKTEFEHHKYIKKHEATVTGVNRALHHNHKAQNNAPVVDFEGKKFSDKDAIEPGINVFSDEKEDSSNEPKYDEDSSGNSSPEMEKGDVEFSVEDKVSSPNLKSDKSDEKDGSRMVEANIGSENQSLADALKHHAKMSNLKLILPGGHEIKLTGKKKMKNEDSTDESESVTIEGGASNVNNTLANSIAKAIQDINFTSKKTKTTHVIGEGKAKGHTRSYYGDGFGHAGGGFGGEAPGFGMGHMGDNNGEGMGHGFNEGGPLPMTDHAMLPLDHGAMPEGHAHGVPEMHHTGAVAMVPALLHHDRSEYDHETGELHEGGTHIEPLVPIHGGDHGGGMGMGHGGGMGMGHVGSDMIAGHGGPDMGMGHGGGMEHSLGMMPPHGIDMDHGMGDHHMPEMHAPMPDVHHDHHHHLEPLPVMPAAPVAPAKPHKPDVIKVEFVPEEATVEAVNKSKIGTPSKKAGTVRVQFIPGDGPSETPTQDAAARHNPPKESSTAQSKEPPVSSKPQTSTSNIQEKVSQMMQAVTTKTANSPSHDQHATTKQKSVNGYEANPTLPGEAKSVDVSKETLKPQYDSSSVTLSNEATKFVGGSSGGGGGGGGDARFMSERIDPPLTTLGQKYQEALQGEQKAAIASEEKAETAQGPDDRVYFGGGPQLAQPDPTPTEHSPSTEAPGNEPGYHGPVINPIANHLVEAMNQRAVSTEEALQMMNDFVSGNQDMNKAAKNMEGMLSQISSQRHAMQPNPENMVHTAPLSHPEETAHFINNPDQVNPNLETGLTNPSYPALHPNGAGFNPEPSSGLFNEHNEQSTPAFQYAGSQRDEPHEPPTINSGPNIMAQINQATPDGPPPPVHIFDNDKSNSPSLEHTSETSDDNINNNNNNYNNNNNNNNENSNNNMVVEPIHSSYDGFANPSFNKEIPSLPSDNALNSMINKIDPHDAESEANQETVFKSNSGESTFLPHDIPNDQTLVQPESMPQVDFPQSAQQGPHQDAMEHQQTEVSSNLQQPPSQQEVSSALQQPIPQQEVTGGNSQSFTSPPGTEMQYNDNSEAELPQGHIVETQGNFQGGDFGGFTEDASNFARKFQMPHKTAALKNQNQQFQKSKTKEQTGKRKHEVIADFYADSIFPEDFTDIESLKGSLQGKTLTNFDRQVEHHVTGARKTIKRVHSEIKASYPLEGRVTKSEIGGSTTHLKAPRKLTLLKERVYKGIIRKNKSKGKNTKARNEKKTFVTRKIKHRRHRRSVEMTKQLPVDAKQQPILRKQENSVIRHFETSPKYAPRKSSKYLNHNFNNQHPIQRSQKISSLGVKSSRQTTGSTENAFKPRVAEPKFHPYINSRKSGHFTRHNKLTDSEPEEIREDEKAAMQNTRVNAEPTPEIKQSNSMYPEKTDWADILPAHNVKTNRVVELPLESHVGVVNAPSTDTVADYTSNHVNQESSHNVNEDTLRPQQPENDRATLRRLVSELKDVLHRIHNANPETHNPIEDATVKSATNVLDEPDVTQFEAISKGDLLSAFANVGKPQPIHSVDIESYTQDVWEPGLKGMMGDSLYGPSATFKRGSVPNTNSIEAKIKQKHFHNEIKDK